MPASLEKYSILSFRMAIMNVKSARIIHFRLFSQLHLIKSAKTALTKLKVVQAALLNYTLAIGWNQGLPQSFIVT